MSKKIFFLISGFLAGVLGRSFFDWGAAFIISIFILAGVGLIRRETRLATLFLCAAALGIIRFNLADAPPSAALAARVGETVQIEGRVAAEPDEREDRQLVTLALANSDSRILATLPPFPRVEYGARLQVVGRLAAPASFLTDTGRLFDYEQYLAKDNIHFRLLDGRGEVIAPPRALSLIGWLIKFKHRLLDRFEQVLPEPESSLAAGLTLGVKQSLGAELTEAFRRTGLTHIIVLSGYNLTLISLGVFFVLSPLPAKWRLGLAALVIILFTLMVGAGPAAVRAALMALIGLLGRWLGRPYEAARALMAAGFLMVLWNPKILVSDLGFQLSFLATLGLIYLSPLVENKLKFIPDKIKPVRELLAVTVAAQVAVLPWLAYKIGIVSIISLLANLLVLPIVPAAMFFLLFAPLGLVWATPAYISLAMIIKIVDLLAAIPRASVTVPAFPVMLTFILYGFIYWWSIRQKRALRVKEKID